VTITLPDAITADPLALLADTGLVEAHCRRGLLVLGLSERELRNQSSDRFISADLAALVDFDGGASCGNPASRYLASR